MKILVIRRDNIGDLVCTTPLFAALRRRHPTAWIGALVNSYNAPVLAANPHVDETVAYRKVKHLGPGESAVSAVVGKVASLWRLRRMKLDLIMLAAPGTPERGLALARWMKPKRIAGFDDGSARTRALDMRVPLATLRAEHEVERVFALARLVGIEGAPPPLLVTPGQDAVARAAAALGPSPGPRVAVHISARRPLQRWPAERFADLIRRLAAERGARVLLLWSPGAEDHPQHPGDDAKAAAIHRLAGDAAVPLATQRLEELIGALAACHQVICSDGGAMHLAAALGKPIVAFFGDSPVERWRPWGVPHRIVRPASGNVADAPVAEVLAAYDGVAAPQALR